MIGRVLGVVEEHQLAGALRRPWHGPRFRRCGTQPSTPVRAPASRGSRPIAFAALVERRQRLARVHDDVGAGAVLQRRHARRSRDAATVAGGSARPPHSEPSASCSACETARAHEAVAIVRLAVRETRSDGSSRRHRRDESVRAAGAPGSRCCADRRRRCRRGSRPRSHRDRRRSPPPCSGVQAPFR